MILVTGANGQYGSAVINYLLEKSVHPKQITAMVRNKKSMEAFGNKGVNIKQGDYNNFSSLVQAFTGIEKLLFISSSDVANRMAQHENVVNAAKEAGVKHIIYTSFIINNETETSPLWSLSKSHFQTEQWIKESGIHHTILKNSLYLEFIPAYVGEQVLETGMFYVPAENGKVGAVLRSEMAEATATILMNPNLQGKIYNFSNTEAFSYHEVANVITEITGKSITYISPSGVEYKQTLAQFGVPDDAIDVLTNFAIAQAKDELDSVSTDLELLLGRKPTSLKTFLSQVYI